MTPTVITLAWTLLLLAIDQIWIQGASSLHRSVVQAVQGSELTVDLVAGAGFYALGALAFYTFLLNNPSVNEKNVALYAFILGICMFGTFDLTNKAIFKNYTWDYAIKDTLWGGFVFAVTSFIIYQVKSNFL